MSNLFKYTKRVLTSVLAAAVVLTAIPSTAFGAELDEDIEVVTLQEDAQESEVTEAGAVEEDAFTVDGASGEEVIEEGEENRDLTYEDTDLYVTMGDTTASLPANTNAVVLAGDTASAFGAAFNTATYTAADGITKVDATGNIYTMKGKIDSALGAEVYIVPTYGHSLASDLEIKVKAKYTKNGTATEIADSDWSVTDVDLSQLDGTYDWGKAKKVTIKPGAFLTGYADTTNTKNSYLAIILNNKAASLNKVPFTVTVDGKAKASGYAFDATATKATANDLVASVKTTDVSNGFAANFADETYDVSVAIVDSTGKKLVEYKRNGVSKTDAGTEGAKMTDDNAFFLATETAAVNLYLSDQGVKTAYEYSKKKTGTLAVAFTKKSTAPATEYTVSSNDSSYATLKSGVTVGSGTEIKTTASTVKATDGEDFFFNVVPKGTQNILSVEYYINGMPGKHAAIGFDKSRATFVGDNSKELYTAVSSPSGDPSLLSYYEFDASKVQYVASTDTSVVSGKTYYTKAGSTSDAVATAGLYGIPYTAHGSAYKETVKGDITIFVTTSATVNYDVETFDGSGTAKHTYVDITAKDASDSNYTITGGAAGTDVSGAGALSSSAVIGKPYTFTIAAISGKKIKSVTAKMIPNATGTTAQAVDLEKGNYGQYTIANVTGTVTIIARTEDDDVATKATVMKVGTGATDPDNVVIKEKTTGTQVPKSPGAAIATPQEAFDFVVTPVSTFGIAKVEYEMGGADKATLTPVSEKANGEKEYHIAKVTGDINITVTTAASANAVDITKQANKDAKLTFNNEVIADGKTVRALKNNDFTFKVEGQNGAEVLGVWYHTAALTSANYTASTNTMSAGNKLSSTSGTYTISAGALTGDLFICIVTKRAEAASAYTGKIQATVGNQAAIADATEVTMRAGGKALNTASKNTKNVNAEAKFVASFFDKDGLNISNAANTVYTVEKKTAKTALLDCNATTGAINASVALTTNVAGAGKSSDTLTATLTAGTFPQFVTYTKSLTVNVEPLSTMYDKVELAQAITSPTTTGRATIAADPGNTIRVDSAAGTDIATYSLIPYVTVGGESKKQAALVNNDVDGNTGYVKSVLWSSDPEVPASVKTAAKPFVFTGATSSATATIATAKESGIGEVGVECTLNFADGSTLKTNKGTTNIIAESYGFFAIPTVTVNGSTIFNPTTINLETNGNIKTASIKWDVYETATATGYTTAGTNFATALALPTQKALDAIVDGYDIKKVDSSTVTFNLEADKANADKVSITSGATTSVTAAKKGTATLSLKAAKSSMPVVARNITANIAYNMPTVKVHVTTGGAAALAKFNTGYQNPAYLNTASVKSIPGVTVSEDIDANKKTVGHYLMNVPVGTVITMPNQAAAFDPATVDPKWKLYGWKITAGATTYVKIGDNVAIAANTAEIEPLWAPKYSGTNGAIDVIRYDNEIAKDLTANTHALTIAVGTETEPIEVPIAVRYKTLDLAKGPNTTAGGTPQYATTWTTDNSSKLVLEATGVSTTGNKISTEATLISAVAVAVKYTDADGVVYADYDGTNNDDLGTKTINVSSHAKTAAELKIVANETDEIKGKVGQTITVAANKFEIGGASKNWDDAAVASVKASTANTGIATAVNPTGANKNIVLTGKGVGETTLTVTATLVDGTNVTATAKVKIEASDLEIVATINGEVMGDTLYFQVNNASNSLVWDIKKGGEIVSGTVDADWSFQIERLGEFPGTTLPEGEVEWNMVKAGTSGGKDVITGAGKTTTVDTTRSIEDTSEKVKLGKGQLTVTYSDSVGTNGTYKKTYPVVTYQAVTVKAPATTALAAKYAVKKNGTALAAGKDDVVKLAYVPGQAKYDFATSAYTAEWLDTEDPHDPYWWEAAYTTSPSAMSKIADFGDAYTWSKAQLEAVTTSLPIVFAPAFGSPRVTISNIPDSITLSDETLSTTTALGTDTAVIKMGVTPYNSYTTNKISVGANNYDMFVLGIGDRSQTATTPGDRLDLSLAASRWNPGTSTVNVSSGNDADPDILDKSVVATASVTSGKSRTDTFTVAKFNDDGKQYVGKSTISIIADGDVYKTVDLFINGEYNTGIKDSDGAWIYHYMKDGKDLVDGVAVVKGAKHYYKDSRRVDGGIVDVQGGKILINAGAQVTTVGKASYDGKYYYIGTDGFVMVGKQFNGLVTTGALADNTKTYLADADGVLTQSKLVGKNYYDDNCQMAVASASAKDYEATSDGKYYVNVAGEVAINGIFKVAGKDRLFRTDGTIVVHTDADVKDGKCVVDGVTYLIADDDTAKRDDVWYNPSVTWTTKFPSKWDKKEAIPTMAYQVTYTSANTGEKPTTDSIIATVTPTSVAADATEVTFTATADLSAYFKDKAGTQKAENVTISKTYKFQGGGEEGKSGQEVDPDGDISIEDLNDSYPWTGKQIKPAFRVYDNVNSRYLAKGVDFTVKYGKNKDAGTKAGSVTITGKGNYAKTGTAATFDIVKEDLDDPAGEVKSIAKPSAMEYTGSPLYPETLSVTLNDSSKTVITMEHKGDGVYGNAAIGGKELSVSVINNVDKGTATVAVWGAKKNGKDVVKTTTFAIKAASMEGANAEKLGNPFEVSISDTADYRIKNTRPTVSISFNGNELVEGQDYKVTVNVKQAKVTVAGKGNFTKKFEQNFTVTPLDLDDCEMVAATAFEGAKPAAVKPTILDPNGDVVPAKNYTLTYDYDSDALDSKGKLIAGKTIKVIATAKGDNVEAESVVSETFTVAANLGKASFKANNSVTYTGSPIILDDEWVNKNVTATAKVSGAKKTLVSGEDFEITGFTNNVKKGSMTVYVSGKDAFSGTKSFKVKIVAKPLAK